MKYSSKLYLILAVLCFGMSNQAFAAKVPPGTVLAKEQIFIRAEPAEHQTLDPTLSEDVAGSKIIRDVFETLYVLDKNGATVPGVALRHEVSDDNLVYTLHLRRNAKWSDGNPVTAHDFVYAWQRIANPEMAAEYSWFLELMSVKNASEIIAGEKPVDALGVKALDDYTLVVHLEKPVPYFYKMLANFSTSPLPRWAIEKHGDKWIEPENLVSNGAYVRTEYVYNERTVLERNKYYWDNENTILDKVVVLIIGNQVQALTRWKAGEVDLIHTPVGQYQNLKDQFKDQVISTPRLCSYYLIYNLSDSGQEAYKDVRVRKALSYAIDRKVITEQVLKGGESPAYSIVHYLTDGFTPTPTKFSTLSQKELDEKAKQLLTEAGYGKGGKTLNIEYFYNTNESHQKVALVVGQMWKQKLGVETTFQNQEWTTYLDNRGNQRFDIARHGWCGDYNEASTFLDILDTKSSYNDGKYSSARVDELLSQAKSLKDPSKLYSEVEKIVAEEMAVIPIYSYVTNIMLKNIGGYPTNNVMGRFYSKNLYRIKE